ncbi:MAG: tetratricopeptide repeat protein [Gemmatimonadaceae bacterium]
MTAPPLRGARAELDAARPAIARLDVARGAEDVAADLIETWSAVESALRSLVGSSTLTGQGLIRETRQRQLIDFDLANTLAEFLAARDRVHDTAYQPTQADVNSAREAFLKLDASMLTASSVQPGSQPLGSAARAAALPSASGAPLSGPVTTTPWVPAADSNAVKTVRPPGRFSPWLLSIIAIVIVAGLGVGGYFMFRGDGGGSLQAGIDAYRAGQREVAVSAFNKAARDDPKAAMPHVYLARMAREVGNATLASQELQLALEAEPNNASALREMGANLLAQGNFELARRFYVRAVEADPTDKTSQGYLGCALMRLNRVQEATTFMDRAGPGPWTSCTPATQKTVGKP